MDALHDLDVVRLVPPLGARHDGRPFFSASSAVAITDADALRIDGDRLLREHVLAGLDRRREVGRPEDTAGAARITRSQSGREDLLERVEPGERGLGRRRSRGRPECFLSSAFDSSSMSGNRSPIAVITISGDASAQSRAAPVPRPPQPMRPDLDPLRRVGGEGAAGRVERRGQRGHRRGLENLPAGHARRIGLGLVFHGMTPARCPPALASRATAGRITPRRVAAAGQKRACRMRSSPANRPLPVARMTTSAPSSTRFLFTIR